MIVSFFFLTKFKISQISKQKTNTRKKKYIKKTKKKKSFVIYSCPCRLFIINSTK